MLNICIHTQFKILQIFPFMLINVIKLNKLMEPTLTATMFANYLVQGI